MSVLASTSAQAALLLPDAGQTSRDVQQERLLNPPKAISPPVLEGVKKAPAIEQDPTPIEVSTIVVIGSHAFPAATLENLVADLAGTTSTLAELEAGAARITAYYREQGFMLATAYIPAQDIRNGVLKIAVQEGSLDQVVLNNTSRVSSDRVNAHLQSLVQADALQEQLLNRKLLLLRDTPGIASVRGVLQPGAAPGTSDLLIETTPSSPYGGQAQIDNFGNRYTGEYRVGATFAINSPLNIGDQLVARVIASDHHMAYGRLAYHFPVGGDGLRIGAAYGYTEYELGREFRLLDAHGTATSSSVFATYPLVLGRKGSLLSSLTYEDRSLRDMIDSIDNTTKKTVRLLNFGLAGNYQDALNGAGLSAFNLSLTSGRLSMDDVSRAIDDLTAQSHGAFTKSTYMINRLQRLSDRDTFFVNIAGQWAGDNLNSSDKYSLGGPYGVRAYPQGEADGDQGNVINLEWRHSFMPQLQGMLFYDYGNIKFNHDNFTAQDNTRSIAGAGVGIYAELFNRFDLNAYLAWRTQGGIPLSEPSSSERTPRLWVQFSGGF